MENKDPYSVIAGYMPAHIRQAMLTISEDKLCRLTEIRLYTGRNIAYIFPGRIRFLTWEGRLTADHKDSACITVSADDMRAAVQSLCHYSLHSCTKELREGFIVLSGGIRVGIAGRVSETADHIITDHSGLNFRISRCAEGSAEELFQRTGKGAGSILICGGVNSGKTTLLRDLCRLCGNSMKTALIDERNEISSSNGGVCLNDVGALTDVISGSSRSEGILMAIRTLSPEIIFCDEISDESDSRAILSGHGSGVRFAATLHAENFDDIFRRTAAVPLISAGVFSHAVILEGSGAPSKIREIRRLGNASESSGGITFHNSRSGGWLGRS